MVDYTKPAYWDETYKRWRGGAELAEELRQAYTAKHVWARIAAQNPMGPSQTNGSSGVCKGCARRKEQISAFKQKAQTKMKQQIATLRGRGEGRQAWVNRPRQVQSPPPPPPITRA